MTDLSRALGPIYRRIMLMVGRGTLSMTNDGSGQQRMQVELLDGETRDVADRVQQYGISSHPPAGSHVVVLNVGGQRDHPLIIGADDPSARPTNLGAGEVMIWSAHGHRTHMRADGGMLITTQEGHRVEYKPGGGFEIECQDAVVKATGSVRMETPALNVTGDIKDQCDAGGMTMQAMRDRYNAHTNGGYGPPSPLMSP
jgi:phage baseplate assembly protein V